MGIGIRQRLPDGTVYLDTSERDYPAVLGRITVPNNQAGSFTDAAIQGRQVTWFWFGAAGARRSQVSYSGNTINWDGSGTGGVIVYGASGPGPVVNVGAGPARVGFRILRNGRLAMDETMFGWHMVAKGNARSGGSDPPFFVAHPDPAKPPLIALSGVNRVGVISMVPVSGGTNVKLVGNGGGVDWYAFAEFRPGVYTRGVGMRWWKNGVIAGDTSCPTLRFVAQNIVYPAGGFANGSLGVDQLLECATIPSGRKYAFIVSDPGFHFDSSGGQGGGQTTTKMVAGYTQDNKVYAQGTVYSTTPGGGTSPTINLPGMIHVIDVTGFDQF